MKMKILIAEDSATDRLIIGNMLKQHDVLTAVNGMEAMNILRNNKGIEIIVLDLFMPEMNGFEVLEAIRADESLSGIRTIVLTNSDELENELKALHLGAVDYIRKPINMESLKTRIAVHEELLRLHHLISDKLDEESLIFSSIFQQAPIGIAISYNDDPFSTGDTRYAAINPMYEIITGRTRDELTRIGWASITHPDDVEADLENNRRMQAGEIESYSMEKRYIKPDGSLVWVYMVVAALKNDVSKKYNHICLIQDISQRKAAEAGLAESERSKSVLLSHLPGMEYRCKLDRNWSMEFVSAGCLGLTGYGPEALIGNRDLAFNDIIAPEYRDVLWDYWQKALSS
ncbi:MAG: response regulator, partial [Eubacteriales bacterium]|nr:response regulator [Eubacteriales bacterium]